MSNISLVRIILKTLVLVLQDTICLRYKHKIFGRMFFYLNLHYTKHLNTASATCVCPFNIDGGCVVKTVL
jgi:hypothetical protein